MEELAASIYRVFLHPKDGGGRFLRKFGNELPDYMVSQFGR
jgi:hypothetical protein